MRSSLPFIPISSSKLSSTLHSLLGASPSSSSISQARPSQQAYSVYPPSPPSSAPSSPTSHATLVAPSHASSASSDASSIRSTKSNYTNPLQQALAVPSSPIKPLLTPRNSHDGTSANDEEVSKAPRNILKTIFPTSSPIHQLPATNVELGQISSSWKGAVIDNPAMGTRSLYISGGSYQDVNLRDSVCEVLELAEEKLGCTGVVMVVEKNGVDVGELVHQLVYVGGTITSSPFAANPAYILVALDLL